MHRAFDVDGGRLELVEGDITAQDVDAIVNAANSALAGGGGVDGAIHRAAGARELSAACREIGSCPTGSAVITPGFALAAKWVIHAVGPIWGGGRRGEPEQLRSAYLASFEIASSRGLRSIAFPSLSTGAYGYPMHKAAKLALVTARDHLQQGSSVTLVRFVLFGAPAFGVLEAAADALFGSVSR